MIGRRTLPEEYLAFNQRWGVPLGWPEAGGVSLAERLADPKREYGPFAFQLASGTRILEYPWAFLTADAAPGSRILDVGGCLGGLQFVFALSGCQVVNVDPLDEGGVGWPYASSQRLAVTPEVHDRINAALGTDVVLIPKQLQDAELAEESFDRAVCLSVLEHLSDADARDVVARIGSLLRPGGLFLATIDLFLDLKPFGVLTRNLYGTNIDVRALVEASGLELVGGDPRELFGYPEFDRDGIVAQLDELMVAERYPVLTQTIVLRRPPR